MSPAVRLEGARVEADGAPILGPVDLVVERGQHVVVLGPSGSGKTTLLRLIAGLARPAGGRVLLGETPVSDERRILVPAERRRIGMLFQDGALWPHMTARATLEFVLRHGGVARSDRQRRAEELLSLVELSGKEDRLPGTLSGGEAQRLSLARALAGEPELLLLDEPLGPLDAALRQALLARIDEIRRERGLTLLHVTHDPAESEAYTDRTVTLEAGRIQGEAPSEAT